MISVLVLVSLMLPNHLLGGGTLYFPPQVPKRVNEVHRIAHFLTESRYIKFTLSLNVNFYSLRKICHEYNSPQIVLF